jgi:hypothetical protein
MIPCVLGTENMDRIEDMRKNIIRFFTLTLEFRSSFAGFRRTLLYTVPINDAIPAAEKRRLIKSD